MERSGENCDFEDHKTEQSLGLEQVATFQIMSCQDAVKLGKSIQPLYLKLL